MAAVGTKSLSARPRASAASIANGNEVAWLGVVLVGLFLLTSLSTWTVDDHGWRMGGGRAANACGPVGAWAADGLYELLGYGAWSAFGLPVAGILGMAGRRLIDGRQVAGVGVASVVVLGLSALAFEAGPGGVHLAGGVVGDAVAGVLTGTVGRLGAWISLTGGLLASGSLLSGLPLGALAQRLVEAAERAAPPARKAAAQVGARAGELLAQGGAATARGTATLARVGAKKTVEGLAWSGRATVTAGTRGLGALGEAGAGSAGVLRRMASAWTRSESVGFDEEEPWADALESDDATDEVTGAPTAVAAMTSATQVGEGPEKLLQMAGGRPSSAQESAGATAAARMAADVRARSVPAPLIDELPWEPTDEVDEPEVLRLFPSFGSRKSLGAARRVASPATLPMPEMERAPVVERPVIPAAAAPPLAVSEVASARSGEVSDRREAAPRDPVAAPVAAPAEVRRADAPVERPVPSGDRVVSQFERPGASTHTDAAPADRRVVAEVAATSPVPVALAAVPVALAAEPVARAAGPVAPEVTVAPHVTAAPRGEAAPVAADADPFEDELAALEALLHADYDAPTRAAAEITAPRVAPPVAPPSPRFDPIETVEPSRARYLDEEEDEDEEPPAPAPRPVTLAVVTPTFDAPGAMTPQVAPTVGHAPIDLQIQVHRSDYLDVVVQDDGRALHRPESKEWELPPLALLDTVPHQEALFEPEGLARMASTVEQSLESFKVTGKVTDVRVGPVVTTFEYLPDSGISVRRITGLADDLAMNLKALSVRVVAPIPGKGVVGIEIPSAQRMTIYLRQLLAGPEIRDPRLALPCILGKSVEGKPMIADLAKMPHLLIGGTTGSGKSVGVNGMLMSMLFTRTPKELRLLLVDPKKLEFEAYANIPHLLHPVVTQPNLASAALAWCCKEMEERYELLARWGVRNIRGFNEKVERERESWTPEKAWKFAPRDWDGEVPPPPPEKLPYIVIVIDELADLMMVAKKDVQDSIVRLAQMARACGMHLIVATQRPSVDVITGLIKANLPTRIAFKLRSIMDSRTILDQGGAEKLLGGGDMLYLPGAGEIERCHGAFVSDDEVMRVTDMLRAQGKPQYIEAITAEAEAAAEIDESEMDPLYEQAMEVVLQAGKASTSMVQRHLKIGYNRAARIIDLMEQAGVVGPADGARPREVLMGRG